MMVVVGKRARLRTGCAAVCLFVLPNSELGPNGLAESQYTQSSSSSIWTEWSTICCLHRALTRTRGGHRLLCYSDLLLKKTANDARHAHHWSFLSKAPSSGERIATLM
jgi:hypothetical protein